MKQEQKATNCPDNSNNNNGGALSGYGNLNAKYGCLSTEQINRDTVDIDISSTEEIIRLINNEDKKVAFAIEKEIHSIAAAVDMIAEKLKEGGRLIFIGAGTSGRLGILDASECPPTFGTDPDMVTGIIAGGEKAIQFASEGDEDNCARGADDIRLKNVTEKDAVVGISASGQAPYVRGALEEARRRGAATVALTNASGAEIEAAADLTITVLTGPEVIMGSTRMKAGTACKMVLNMLTTASMIRIGKVYRNMMVDMVPSNKKLKDRIIRILMFAADADRDAAEAAMKEANDEPKSAIVMLLTGCSHEQAVYCLSRNSGIIRKAIKVKEQNES